MTGVYLRKAQRKTEVHYSPVHFPGAAARGGGGGGGGGGGQAPPRKIVRGASPPLTPSS